MDRRRAGILAALLFLASVLTIEAVGADSTTGPSVAAASTDPGSSTTNRDVRYYGDGIVYVGDRWKILCLGLTSTDEVEWTRDGQSLQAEIDSHELHFTRLALGSELSADAAKKEHSGTYKCMKLPTEGHEIRVQDANSGTQPAAALPPTTLTIAETPLVATPNNYSWVIGPQGLTLTCGDSAPANPIWRRNGTEIVQTNKDDFRVENSTLFLRKASPLTYGNYSCYANDKATIALVNYTVVAEPHTKLPRHSSVVEGEKLHLTCATDPSLAPEIIWVFGNSSYSTSSGRVTVADDDQGVKSATLTIDNMEREDAGNVSCLVNYTKLKDFRGEAVTYLRVKDKLAALWPFLGICAEVVILCAIILVYEKKRNKAELDESDTDQSPDTKPTPNKDSEVRQRK